MITVMHKRGMFVLEPSQIEYCDASYPYVKKSGVQEILVSVITKYGITYMIDMCTTMEKAQSRTIQIMNHATGKSEQDILITNKEYDLGIVIE